MRKSYSVFSMLLIISVFVTGVLSQSAQTQQKPEQDQSVQLRSDLIEIHAVVTDKQGHTIKDLKKEDFEIFENKNPQKIGFFSAESVSAKSNTGTNNPGANPSVQPPARTLPPARTVVIYIDTLHLSVSSLLFAKQALNKFVDQQLTDSDAAALITSTGSLGVLEQFTRNKQILHYAINRLSPGPVPSDDLYTPYIAGMVERLDPDAINLAVSILRMQGEQGDRRMLVQIAQAKASSILGEASYRRTSTLYTLKAIAERMTELKGQRIITVVSDGFSLMDRSGGADTGDLNAAISRAVRSGVVMYTIDAKGLTPPPGFSASMPGSVGPQTANLLTSYLSASEEESRDGLNALARDTGGEAFFNNNDISGLLKKALDENEYYYSLAYYPEGEANSRRFRNINVKIKNHPEYQVRTQKGYSPDEIFKTKKDELQTPQQKLFQAIAAPLPITNINVAADANFLGQEGDPMRVIFQADIDGGNINYTMQNDRYHFDLDMSTVVYDASGKPVNTINEKLQGNLSPERIDQHKRDGYHISKTLSLKPGLYQIRIGVREQTTERAGTAMAWVVVPNLAKNKLTTSGIFLVDAAGGASAAAPQSRVHDGIRFYKPGAVLIYNLRIYKNELAASGGSGLTMQTSIADSGTLVQQTDWQPAGARIIGKDGTGIDLGDKIALDLKPGIYELHILVKDEKSKHPVEQSVVFGIEN